MWSGFFLWQCNKPPQSYGFFLHNPSNYSCPIYSVTMPKWLTLFATIKQHNEYLFLFGYNNSYSPCRSEALGQSEVCKTRWRPRKSIQNMWEVQTSPWKYKRNRWRVSVREEKSGALWPRIVLWAGEEDTWRRNKTVPLADLRAPSTGCDSAPESRRR